MRIDLHDVDREAKDREMEENQVKDNLSNYLYTVKKKILNPFPKTKLSVGSDGNMVDRTTRENKGIGIYAIRKSWLFTRGNPLLLFWPHRDLRNKTWDFTVYIRKDIGLDEGDISEAFAKIPNANVITIRFCNSLDEFRYFWANED